MLIGLDTNVLVRFLVKNEARQARSAVAFVTRACTVEDPCRINRIVLCELQWVLESAYDYPGAVVAEALSRILRTREFVVEDANDAWGALRDYGAGTSDFADTLLARVNRRAGCEHSATFDRRAARLDGFDLVR